jgi:glycosyltransferase involved in cell wall biosynthesis
VQVTVVVPTYNEAENIETLCRAVHTADPTARILVVDDGSPDGTADIAEKLAEQLPVDVLRRTVKGGLGPAYVAGFRRAIDDGADIVVQMDADLSHDPAVMPALTANIQHGADLAIGSRYVPGGITINWPRRRRWLSRWGNRYAAGVLGLGVNDATAGYRAYRASALEAMDFETVRGNGYGFQIEMTHRAVRRNDKVVEFPIAFRDRSAGDSKMSGGIVREALILVLKLWVSDLGGRRARRAQGR